jgi:RNA polymerase sigma-70 factor (ECF subfamily)
MGREQTVSSYDFAKAPTVFTLEWLQRLCDVQNFQAWDEFVAAFAPGVRTTIHRILSARAASCQADDLDEISQKVFLRLINHDFQLLRSYDPARGASFSTWLSMVTRSVTLDCLKERPSVSFVSLDSAAEIAAPAVFHEEPLVFPAGVLSLREEETLRFLFEEGLSAEETAEKLGIKAKTVYLHKDNAINKLRKNMGVMPEQK